MFLKKRLKYPIYILEVFCTLYLVKAPLAAMTASSLLGNDPTSLVLVEVSPILLGRKRVGQKVLVCSHFLPRCSQPCCRKTSPQHVSTTFFDCRDDITEVMLRVWSGFLLTLLRKLCPNS